MASNADPFLPMPDGKMPGAGATVNFISCASGVEPFIIAKPSAYLMNCAIEKHGLDRSRCIMIGDRMDTDIL